MLSETRWPDEKFSELHRWLEVGGLEAIADWAQSYGDYVQPGKHAPDSVRKSKMIQDSYSEYVAEAIELVELALVDANPIAISDIRLLDRVKKELGGKCYDKPLTLRKALEHEGWVRFDDRVSYKGRNHYVVLNPAAGQRADAIGDSEAKDFIRNLLAEWDRKGPGMGNGTPKSHFFVVFGLLRNAKSRKKIGKKDLPKKRPKMGFGRLGKKHRPIHNESSSWFSARSPAKSLVGAEEKPKERLLDVRRQMAPVRRHGGSWASSESTKQVSESILDQMGNVSTVGTPRGVGRAESCHSLHVRTG